MTLCVTSTRSAHIASTLAAAALLIAGCQERRFDSGLITDAGGDRGSTIRDGGGDTPRVDLARRDIEPHDGLEGEAGECKPNNGGLEVCNAIDDDCNGVTDDVHLSQLQTDIGNCGSCFHLCNLPNAESECKEAKCVITRCQGTTVDSDKKPETGCECTPTNGGVEICDNKDNNCDGRTDEGFLFTTDINNCGTCNHVCQFPFAAASCTDGKCVMGACQANFYNRDDKTDNGCEVMCVATGAEVCDGIDNDCNGQIDDGVTPTTPCKTAGVCTGTTPVCSGPTGWTCSYTDPAYQQVEDKSQGCDNKDNDCDGTTDEAFSIGKTCTVGKGACSNSGQWVCDSGTKQAKCSASPKPPQQEVCNGVDDNCNDLVDEIASATSSDDGFVYIAPGDGGAGAGVTMFAYEAARYDATSSTAGFDSNRRPCSLPSRIPWTNVSQEEAETACERILGKDGLPMGWRLCSADDWERACNGGKAIGTAAFPYAGSYDPNACNGYDFGQGKPIATGTAQDCVAWVGSKSLSDMSGNVKEWVLTSTTAPFSFALRGGAYNTMSFNNKTSAPGLQCNASTPAPAGVAVRLPSVGFRCCFAGQLPTN